MNFKILREVIQQIISEKYDDHDVVVYHASPQLSLSQIRPRYSPKYEEKGVFVSSSKEAMIEDWINWATRKPEKDKTGRTDNLYHTFALYTIKIPYSLFKKIEEHNKTVYRLHKGNLGAFGWNIENFVPESLLEDGYLTPSSVKVYKAADYKNLSYKIKQWKSPVSKPKRPEVEEYSESRKNPAKEYYNVLKHRIPEYTLQSKSDLQYSENLEKLYKLLGDLKKLAEKKRLNIEDNEFFINLQNEVDSIIIRK